MDASACAHGFSCVPNEHGSGFRCEGDPLPYGSDCASPPPPGGLQGEVFLVARECELAVRSVSAPVCQRYGITVQQSYVLLELARTPGVTIGAVSERAGILRTNFAPICRHLEELGLIERRRSAHDRRSYVLFNTERGYGLLKEVGNEFADRYYEAFCEEDAPRQQALLESLRSLRCFLERHRG